MEIKKLTSTDAEQFCNLIVDMYAHLNNLEWFSPMPYDLENVKSILENPRFYVIGIFDNNFLCAVSSLDYKCGKLIGKLNFPAEVDTNKIVELGFTMVHSTYRGQGLMKKMVNYLLNKIEKDGFKLGFGKVHKDNFASSKSLKYNGFYFLEEYKKPVKKEDFNLFIEKNLLSEETKEKAQQTLNKFEKENEIIVNYEILIKKF